MYTVIVVVKNEQQVAGPSPKPTDVFAIVMLYEKRFPHGKPEAMQPGLIKFEPDDVPDDDLELLELLDVDELLLDELLLLEAELDDEPQQGQFG